MAALYSPIIFQHARAPQNRGQLKAATLILTGANHSCGDELTFYLKLDKNKVIKEVAWNGSGCAISQASASVFSELIIGKKLAAVQKFSGEVLIKKLKTKLSPSRLKCALLPLYTIKQSPSLPRRG